MSKLFLIFFFLFSLNLFALEKGNWKKYDSPFLLIGKDYAQKFNDLPLNGRLGKRPWSDTYWPTYMGGLSLRWSGKTQDFGYKLLTPEEVSKTDLSILSPSEKWDLFMEDSKWTLTNMERQRTEILKTVKGSPEYKRGFEIPKWFGLCHAWAPATLLYDAPGAVTLQNSQGLSIPFYAADIKALLTYNLHVQGDNTKTLFMGSRCNVTLPKFLKGLSMGLLKEDRYLTMVKNENCNDMDAGATHLAIANLLGKEKTGFVMDMTRGSEVWNQGVYSFNSKIVKTTYPPKKRKDLDPILGVAKILNIRTNLVYISEIAPNKKGENFPKASLRDVTYNYEVHLNKDGEIVGGKWLDQMRPDFFWRSIDPGFHPMFTQLKGVYETSAHNAPMEGRIHSKEEIRTLFKDTARKVILAKRFIKNSEQLALERRDKRLKFYNDIKNDLINNAVNLMNIFQ